MKTYSPADIILTLGTIRIQGYAKGTFVKVGRNSESVKLDIGSLGDAVAVTMLDRSGKAVITLQQASSSNSDLSALMRAQELAGRALPLTFQMVNLNGATIHHDASAFLEKPPDEERGDDAGNVEWTIICPRLDMTHGGASF